LIDYCKRATKTPEEPFFVLSGVGGRLDRFAH